MMISSKTLSHFQTPHSGETLVLSDLTTLSQGPTRVAETLEAEGYCGIRDTESPMSEQRASMTKYTIEQQGSCNLLGAVTEKEEERTPPGTRTTASLQLLVNPFPR